MSVRMILLPIFVHVALVFVMLLGNLRSRPNTDSRDAGWRDELALAVLFYVLTLCAWRTQFADILFVLLAWVFVALRIFNHVGSNAAVSTASVIVLAVMWLIYAVRLLVIAG